MLGSTSPGAERAAVQATINKLLQGLRGLAALVKQLSTSP